MLPYRERQYRKDIDLYINSNYAGFQKLETIEDFFGDYKKSAEKMAEAIPPNSIILYAILEYNEHSFVSANFMLLEIPYDIYLELVQKLLNRTRVFFIRGRKDDND